MENYQHPVFRFYAKNLNKVAFQPKIAIINNPVGSFLLRFGCIYCIIQSSTGRKRPGNWRNLQ